MRPPLLNCLRPDDCRGRCAVMASWMGSSLTASSSVPSTHPLESSEHISKTPLSYTMLHSTATSNVAPSHRVCALTVPWRHYPA